MILLESLQKTYRSAQREVVALRDVSLNIAAGEIFGIIGHSGAGKSTLIRLLNRLEIPDAGRVLIDGTDVLGLDDAGLRAFRQQVGMIFQHFNLLFSKTVAENIAFPLRIAGGKTNRDIDARVAELLELVGLADQGDKYPAQLSGGQKQRVGIARALANRPRLLLCDEATSALDPQTTQSVLQLLLDINQRLGLTIVLITHEMDVIRSICDRVAVLDAGRIVESGPVTRVFLHPQHPTTRRFVQEAEHVDENSQADDFAHVPGRIVRLTFVGDATYEAALSRVIRQHVLDFSILAGRIERIKTTPCGQLTLALVGEEPAIDSALAQLAQQGVTVEALR
ncbi:MAG: methionine transporter ATP-binding protein [Proteobacteria bacterium]|nr:methionine transporter ATP-binding protein [Pseudomonadota bacterium]